MSISEYLQKRVDSTDLIADFWWVPTDWIWVIFLTPRNSWPIYLLLWSVASPSLATLLVIIILLKRNICSKISIYEYTEHILFPTFIFAIGTKVTKNVERKRFWIRRSRKTGVHEKLTSSVYSNPSSIMISDWWRVIVLDLGLIGSEKE